MSDSEAEFEDGQEFYFGEYDGERNEAGERHGTGKATLSNGDVYEGQYEKGQRHGEGVYKFKASRVKINRVYNLIFQGGARYVGSYSRNKKVGDGKMYFPDGSVYSGQWDDDKKNGVGEFLTLARKETNNFNLPKFYSKIQLRTPPTL